LYPRGFLAWLRKEESFGSPRKITCFSNRYDIFEKPEFEKIGHGLASWGWRLSSEARRAAPVEIKVRIRVPWKNQDCQSGTMRYPLALAPSALAIDKTNSAIGAKSWTKNRDRKTLVEDSDIWVGMILAFDMRWTQIR
jgi:hypothetical protein